MDKTYVVMQEWDHYNNREKCVITYTFTDIEDYDGYNTIGHKRFNGCNINIYPTLEEAIIKCNFNPAAIDFQLDEIDLIDKETIISNYSWNYKTGLTKKEIENEPN